MGSEEVISAEEAAALLDGVASGELDGTAQAAPGEVVPYDLTDQDHIVRGRLPVLDKISARFVRHFQAGLEHLLQRPVEVSMDVLQTVRCADYIHSLGVPVSVNFVHATPLPGEALIIMDPGMVFTVVDIYFGGDGRYQGQMSGREFTPTETRIIQLVLNQILQDLKQAWEPVMPVEFKAVRSEANPQYSSIANSRETLIVCGFRMELDEFACEFHIALPDSMIEPVRDLLDGGLQKSQSDNEVVWLQALQEKLQEAQVDIYGTIAATTVKLRDVFNLKTGDVIPVELPEQVTLQVGEVPLFQGRFGVHEDRNAVKITTCLNDTK
ncbi:MAG: flagellar motor switch protein FliM [Gammaproteobacteria bacterium]